MFQRSFSTYPRLGVLSFMAVAMVVTDLYASSVPLLNTKRVPRSVVSNTRAHLPKALVSRGNAHLINQNGRVQTFGRSFNQAPANSRASAFVPVVQAVAPPMPNLMPLIALLSQSAEVSARPSSTGNALKAIAALGKRENGFEGFEGSETESPELPEATSAEMPGGGGGGGGPNGGGPSGGPDSGQGNGQHNQQDPNAQRPIDPNAENNNLSHGLGPGSIDENGNFRGEGPGNLNFRNIQDGETNPDDLARPGSLGKGQEGLVKSGEGGNVGWQYQVEDGNSRHGCQATLVSRKNGMCVAATASHCLAEAVNHHSYYRDRTIGSTAARLRIHTADFGLVEAVGHVNPYYINGGIEDSAAFVFKCDESLDVPVVPLCKSYVNPYNTPVEYGKVMGHAQGFYTGKTSQDPGVVLINGFKPGVKQLQVYQYGIPIQQGDSGGPLVVQQGEKCLAGVLSTKEPGTRFSNYAANESLDFIESIVNATEQNSSKANPGLLADDGKRSQGGV